MQALTCEGLDARAFKQPCRAFVIVELLISEVEAGVDVAVLLRDLHIVKIRCGSCGGSHGGSQRGRRSGGGRWVVSSVALGEEAGEWMKGRMGGEYGESLKHIENKKMYSYKRVMYSRVIGPKSWIHRFAGKVSAKRMPSKKYYGQLLIHSKHYFVQSEMILQ